MREQCSLSTIPLKFQHDTLSHISALDLGWTSLFQEFPHSFTVGWALVMLLVDCAIMIFLIYYLDAIRPTDDSPRKHPLFIFRVGRHPFIIHRLHTSLVVAVHKFINRAGNDPEDGGAGTRRGPGGQRNCRE